MHRKFFDIILLVSIFVCLALLLIVAIVGPKEIITPIQTSQPSSGSSSKVIRLDDSELFFPIRKTCWETVKEIEEKYHIGTVRLLVAAEDGLVQQIILKKLYPDNQQQ